jgi:hypothetical protein
MTTRPITVLHRIPCPLINPPSGRRKIPAKVSRPSTVRQQTSKTQGPRRSWSENTRLRADTGLNTPAGPDCRD